MELAGSGRSWRRCRILPVAGDLGRGIEFEIKRELPVGSKVRIRRQLNSVEPWVDVRIEAAVRDKDGTTIVDGTFHA